MHKNAELDAALVEASMDGGFDKFMFAARSLGVPTTQEAIDRANWFKEQTRRNTKYSKQVIELVAARR